MPRILLKKGRLWDGEKFCFADLLTEGEHIAKIGKELNDNADFVYDAEGKIVSAGLVDIHTHLKGISYDEFGICAELCSIPFGVTAVNDAGATYGNKTLLNSFSVRNTVFVAVEIKNNRPNLKNTESLLKKYGNKAVGIKVYFDTGVSEIDNISPLKEVCKYAKERNLLVMVHCSNSSVKMADIVDTLSKNDILTHIYHGGINNCTENNFEALKYARQNGVVLDAGFAGCVHTDFEILKKAIELGFTPDTLSSDITCCSAYKRGGRYGMTMCMSMARAAGMDESSIFKAVTATPAEVLSRGKEWGRLEVGWKADVAVFDFLTEGFSLTDKAGNTLSSSAGYRCALTLFNGQVLFKD